MSKIPDVLVRPEFEASDLGKASKADVARKLTLMERISDMNSVRKLSILVMLVIVWEVYSQFSGVSELIMPKFSATALALADAVFSEQLLYMVWNSITVLITGYVIGIVIATLLTTAAATTRFGSDILSTLTACSIRCPRLLFCRWLCCGSGSVPMLLFSRCCTRLSGRLPLMHMWVL